MKSLRHHVILTRDIHFDFGQFVWWLQWKIIERLRTRISTSVKWVTVVVSKIGHRRLDQKTTTLCPSSICIDCHHYFNLSLVPTTFVASLTFLDAKMRSSTINLAFPWTLKRFSQAKSLLERSDPTSSTEQHEYSCNGLFFFFFWYLLQKVPSNLPNKTEQK